MPCGAQRWASPRVTAASAVVRETDDPHAGLASVVANIAKAAGIGGDFEAVILARMSDLPPVPPERVLQ